MIPEASTGAGLMGETAAEDFEPASTGTGSMKTLRDRETPLALKRNAYATCFERAEAVSRSIC